MIVFLEFIVLDLIEPGNSYLLCLHWTAVMIELTHEYLVMLCEMNI